MSIKVEKEGFQGSKSSSYRYDPELQLKKLSNRFIINPLNWRCLVGNQLYWCCINSECSEQSSFFCGMRQCSYCSQLHNQCSHQTRLPFIMRKLQKISEARKQLIISLYRKEEQMIKKIRQARQEEVERFRFPFFGSELNKIIGEFFQTQEEPKASSQQISSLVKNLESFQGSSFERQHIQKFEKETKVIQKRISSIRRGVILQSEAKSSIEQINKVQKQRNVNKEQQQLNDHESEADLEMNESMEIQENQNDVQDRKHEDPLFQNESWHSEQQSSQSKQYNHSKPARQFYEKIVSSPFGENIEDSFLLGQNKSQQLKFLHKILNHPKRIQLLYKASNFRHSSRKFYDICNKIDNTLILIRASHNRTIGGFTPLTWTQSNNNGRFKADQSLSSFIFSLDMMERFDLIDPSKAINCSRQNGFSFGAGPDLFIASYSNYSSAKFTSYKTNRPSNYPSRQLLEEFTGSSKGHFQVREYEVYKVLWG